MYIPVKFRSMFDGKRDKSFYAKTQQEAIAKRDAAERDMHEGRTNTAKGTFGEYLKRWLDGLQALGQVSARTAGDYHYWTERCLIPHLGKKKLRDLTAEDLDVLYAKLAKDGMGPRE